MRCHRARGLTIEVNDHPMSEVATIASEFFDFTATPVPPTRFVLTLAAAFSTLLPPLGVFVAFVTIDPRAPH